MRQSQRIRGYFLVIASAVIFGCSPLLVKNIYAEGINSLTVILLRNMLSAPVAGLLAYGQRKSLKIPLRALPSIILIGIMGCCIAPLLLFSSYLFIGSGIATVFHFVYPAVVVVGGVLCYRERMTGGNLISVLLCVLGICLFYTPGQPLDLWGSILALASGVAYAAYVMLLAHFRHKEQVSGYLLSFYMFAVNAAVLLAICLAGDFLIIPTSAKAWILCFLVAIVVNVCAVSMFQRGTLLVGGPQASVLSTMEPITGVFMGALVFQEVITLQTGIGAALVILASILIVLFDMRSSREHT